MASQYTVTIFLVASYYRNQHKLQLDGPLGLYTDLTFTLFFAHSNHFFHDSFITMHLGQANQKMFFAVNFLTIQSGPCKS